MTQTAGRRADHLGCCKRRTCAPMQRGRHARILAACDLAVAADPDNGGYRDSRGVARALTCDLAGAIEDFEAYVEWAPSHGRREAAAARTRWIERLRAGSRPASFTELEALGGPP